MLSARWMWRLLTVDYKQNRVTCFTEDYGCSGILGKFIIVSSLGMKHGYMTIRLDKKNTPKYTLPTDRVH